VGRVAYATLFAVIGTTYGPGDGATTFNLPDSRAEVWRGLDLGRGVDAGRALGSAQLDAMQGHQHNYSDGSGTGGSSRTISSSSSNALTSAKTSGPVNDGTNGVPRVAKVTQNGVKVWLNRPGF